MKLINYRSVEIEAAFINKNNKRGPEKLHYVINIYCSASLAVEIFETRYQAASRAAISPK